MKKIWLISKTLGLNIANIERYGEYKAKIKNVEIAPKGKLILVTSINPTSSGEGKTTVSIALADALFKLKHKTCLALREPSLGPVFGMKGGATGGGKSSVQPSEEIDLHFTGDFHAITAANNLLSSMIDNHLYHGNQLQIDPTKVMFHRCMDVNDRALREITLSQEKLKNNIERKESFTITAASELMAIFCLAETEEDLKERLGKIVVAYSKYDKPIYAKELKAENAMFKLLRQAFLPNLVQTNNSTPALIHGGPFANIAHGTNSILATKTALTLADYVVTEAGFGADLGGEKFFDLVCRYYDLKPSCTVIVVTAKALKLHGGASEENLDLNALSEGFKNLKKHIDNLKGIFKQNLVVAINVFDNDYEEELISIENFCKNENIKSARLSPYTVGYKSAINLAQTIIEECKKDVELGYAYDLKDTIIAKTEDICKKVYGAKRVEFSPVALKKASLYENITKAFPVIIAKTQYSFSDDADDLNPKDFTIHIRDFELKNGAGFIVAIAGKMMLMPGLPAIPRATKM